MLILFGFLFGGVITGYLLRRWRVTWIGKVTMALISLGSCLAAMLLWRWARRSERRREADAQAETGGQEAVNGPSAVSEEDGAKARKGALKDSLIIIAFFVAGILLGVSGILPVDLSQTGVAMYALYALILSVGFSVGNNPDIIGGFKRLNPRLALLPLMTILGTLAASYPTSAVSS